MTDEGINRVMTEVEPKVYRVTKIADGLGLGNGAIGVRSRIEDENDPLNDVVRQIAESVIDAGQILVRVDVDKDGKRLDDDGCGDGRGVTAVFEGDPSNLKQKSLNRSKVFGGGVIMETAALIGTGTALDQDLQTLPLAAASRLNLHGIDFGGHTDPHFHNDAGKSGCGAIDKLPEAISSVVKNEQTIRGILEVLGVDEDQSDVVGGVLANYRDYYRHHIENSSEAYNGAQTVQETLINNGKITKELEPSHAEVAVVLNTVAGMTVDQARLREATDGVAQAFAVDVWRLREVADRSFEDPTQRQQAYISMLVHTVAVAEVLTQGDLPVYLVSDKN